MITAKQYVLETGTTNKDNGTGPRIGYFLVIICTYFGEMYKLF